MTKHDKSFFGLDEEGVGVPWEDFVTAVSVWAWCRSEYGESPTVHAAAEAFNVTDETVQQAVADHAWMFITGPDDDPTKQRLEHDGE